MNGMKKMNVTTGIVSEVWFWSFKVSIVLCVQHPQLVFNKYKQIFHHVAIKLSHYATSCMVGWLGYVYSSSILPIVFTHLPLHAYELEIASHSQSLGCTLNPSGMAFFKV